MVILPFRGEFGHKVMWHAPVVHALHGPKTVYMEEGHEALYPSAEEIVLVPSPDDGKRRGTYRSDEAYLKSLQEEIRFRDPSAHFARPMPGWKHKRFIPQPVEVRNIECDVVVCPRKRDYGKSKNWPMWDMLVEELELGNNVNVFTAGSEDTSFHVGSHVAWDYARDIDATIEAMLSAKLVVATDTGTAHLAVLCGRPLLLISHERGLIAPGPQINEKGQSMQSEYGHILLSRYNRANHQEAPLHMVMHGWTHPEEVVKHTLALIADG